MTNAAAKPHYRECVTQRPQDAKGRIQDSSPRNLLSKTFRMVSGFILIIKTHSGLQIFGSLIQNNDLKNIQRRKVDFSSSKVIKVAFPDSILSRLPERTEPCHSGEGSSCPSSLRESQICSMTSSLSRMGIFLISVMLIIRKG